MHRTSFRLLIGGSLLVWAWACTGTGPNAHFLRTHSPHEQYERSLKTASLDRTALGTDWVAAGQQALRDSLRITVPYRESGYFGASQPLAVGYRINGSRGDRFTVRVEVQGHQPGQVFLDVFGLGSRTPDLVAFAKSDTASSPVTELVWEPQRTQTYLIRLQPELLRSGRYTVSVTREPVLRFPVQGRTSRQISSYFGEPRDGGRRRHEGIDIFSPKGTPAIASVSGTITEVAENRLGGKVVFLTDQARRQRLYYAHLDSFNVTQGQRVNLGDTIGLVGNTGNARTTPPHLHFGVYTFEDGAVNPLPFVRLGPGEPRQTLLSPTLLGDSVRISASRGVLRTAPKSDAPVLRELPRYQPLTVLGGHIGWLRVSLPGGETGYVVQSSTEAISQPIRAEALPAALPLLDSTYPRAAVIQYLPASTMVRVLAQQPGFWLVRTAAGQTGWLQQTSGSRL